MHRLCGPRSSLKLQNCLLVEQQSIINFAQSLALLKQATTAEAPSELDIAQLLVAAVKSKSLSDKCSISYALGSLGGLYEQTQQWSDAKVPYPASPASYPGN